jgi:hypothetical protein
MACLNNNLPFINEKPTFLEHIKGSRRNTPADFASIDTNINFDDDEYIEGKIRLLSLQKQEVTVKIKITFPSYMIEEKKETLLKYVHSQLDQMST